MRKILFLMTILAVGLMSCTKDDFVIPGNASVQSKETANKRVQITSDAPIINNTIIALEGTSVELYVEPYHEGNSCRWMVNGRLATEVHGPSMIITSNKPRTSVIQVTIFDASDRGYTSPMITIKWVSR